MIQRDWLADFQAQCERSLARSVEERMRYGFCYVYKPVMDDAPWRSFDWTADSVSDCPLTGQGQEIKPGKSSVTGAN
jgi:hypothetical protein